MRPNLIVFQRGRRALLFQTQTARPGRSPLRRRKRRGRRRISSGVNHQDSEELVAALVAEVRHWMTLDLPVAVLRALRPAELEALRRRLRRVVGGETPYGEERLVPRPEEAEDE